MRLEWKNSPPLQLGWTVGRCRAPGRRRLLPGRSFATLPDCDGRLCPVLLPTLSLGACLASSAWIIDCLLRMQQRWPGCCCAASRQHSGAVQLMFSTFIQHSAVIKGLFDSLVHLWEWRGTHWQDERRLQKRMQAIAESNQTATFLGAL